MTATLALVWLLAAPLPPSASPSPSAAPVDCPALAEEPGWTTSPEDGTQRVRRDVDLDGDGLPDHLEAEESHGSGFGLETLSLKLTRSHEEVKIESESSNYSMTDYLDIPPQLLEPGNACALAVVEKTLFGEVATSEDPSLEWLLTPDDAKTLRWIPGPPVLPSNYTVRGTDDWMFYRGESHRAETPPVELARSGDRVLLGTRRGVILTDPGRTRHAWIYVAGGGGDDKVRLSAILGARIEGDIAVIRVTEGSGELRGAVVRVDLVTGRIMSTPRKAPQGSDRRRISSARRINDRSAALRAASAEGFPSASASSW